MKPLNDRVIVRLDPVPEKIGLIHIPQAAKQIAICRGTVEAVGEGEYLIEAGRHEPSALKPGDHVLFSSVAGVYLDEYKMLIAIRECDIYAIDDIHDAITMKNRLGTQIRDVEV